MDGSSLFLEERYSRQVFFRFVLKQEIMGSAVYRLVWCTKPWAWAKYSAKPNTPTYLNLPTKEMSETNAKLTLNDAKRC